MATYIYPSQTVSISGVATEVKQDVMITELQNVNTELDSQTVLLTSLDGKDYATQTTLASLDGKDFATQTTLAALLTELQLKADLTETQPVSAVSLPLPTGAATEVTLATVAGDTTSIDSKITTVDTGNVTISSSALPTGAATSANQTTANASLSAIETDIDQLNARVAGSLVPETHDYVATTYVAAGNGVGEIETVTYKTGGAGGTTVATLTLAYDASNRLSSVTRS